MRSRRTLLFTLDMSGYFEGGVCGFLSRVFAAPARGSFEANLNRLLRRGGHVTFTKAGDLYVADSAGRNMWSHAEEVEREREREERKRGVAEGAGLDPLAPLALPLPLHHLCEGPHIPPCRVGDVEIASFRESYVASTTGQTVQVGLEATPGRGSKHPGEEAMIPSIRRIYIKMAH